MCEIKWRKSAKPTFTQLQRRTIPKCNPPTLHSELCLKRHFLTLRSVGVIYILGYSDAIKLQRRSTAAVTELVLRCWVYWPNRLGWRQKVLQPPSMFMLLSWWCPLGHGKRHLPPIQIFIVVRLIPILTQLSSRWTVPLNTNFLPCA